MPRNNPTRNEGRKHPALAEIIHERPIWMIHGDWEILRYRASGMTLRQIGKIIDASHEFVRQREKYGLTAWRRRAKPKSWQEYRITCPHCRYRGGDLNWQSFTCEKCGRVHYALYRRDHPDPAVANLMTDEQIETEIKEAI